MNMTKKNVKISICIFMAIVFLISTGMSLMGTNTKVAIDAVNKITVSKVAASDIMTYEELRTAVKDSTDGDIIQIANDITIPVTATIGGTNGSGTYSYMKVTNAVGKNITIQSKGNSAFTIKRIKGSAILEVGSKCTLTLRNIILDGGAQWKSAGGSKTGEITDATKLALGTSRTIVDVSGGKLNIEDGVVLTNGYAIDVKSSDGSGDASAYGGGARIDYATGGTINVKVGAIIKNCYTSGYGGGIGAYGTNTIKSYLNIYGGTISGCGAVIGGAIGATYRNGALESSSATVNMMGGVLENNNANKGGAIYADGSSSVIRKLHGGKISGNSSKIGASLAFFGTPTIELGNIIIDDTNIDTDESTADEIITHTSDESKKYYGISKDKATIKFVAVNTVIFNSNGGSVVPDINALPTVPGEETTLSETMPGSPLKEYFLFDGWYLDDSFINSFDASTSFKETITVYAKWYQATIGTTKYTFEDACEKAQNGDEIKLNIDIEITRSIYLTKQLTITSEIDKTYRIVRGAMTNESMFSISTEGNIEFSNIVLDGGAVWGENGSMVFSASGEYAVTSNNTGVKANAPIIVTSGRLTLDNGAILQNNENAFHSFDSENYGGGIRVSGNGAVVKMNAGSIIKSCYAREGGGIMNVTKFVNATGSAVGSTVIIDGGLITNCASRTKGSAIQTIYGNSVTKIMSGTIIGGKPLETNFGVLTVEEGGTLIVSGGTITNEVIDNAAIYVYNQYVNGYSGYLEGLHAAEFKLLGGSIEGEIGLDASGTVKTSGNHASQAADISKEFYIFIDTVADTNKFAAENYTVFLNGSWHIGDKIINGNGADFTIGGLTSYQFEYKVDANTVVGGMEINQSYVNTDGTVTVIGKLVGVTSSLKVTVDNIETQLKISGNTFTAVTTVRVLAGKKEVKAVYDVGNKSVTSKMLITVPQRDNNDILTGEIDYGTLDNGDMLQYKSTDGSYKTYNGTALPNDIAIDANGFADFRLIESGGDEYDYRAYVGKRVTDVKPDDGALSNDITKTHNSIMVKTEEGYEYRLVDDQGNVIAGNNWKIGVDGTLTYTGLNPETNYAVEVRATGTTDSQPGKTATVAVTTKTEVEQGQDDAKAKLDNVAQAAKDAINTNPNLSTAEKEAKIAAVDIALDNAKTAIGNAITLTNITAEQGNGETAIGAIKAESDELGNSNLAAAKKNIEDEFNKFIIDNCKDSKYTPDDLVILNSKIINVKDKLDAITNIADLDKWIADSIADAKTVKEKAPNAQVDKENDCIEDLATGEYQVIAGGQTYNFTVGEDGKLLLQGKDNDGNAYDFANQKINLIKNGENGFADSNKQAIELPMRVVKPENIPIDAIIVDETSITIKGVTVIDGNKYAVADKDGNILSSGWIVGTNGTDIVFSGLGSGKEYKVVIIGKNSDEPDKLPSNPSNGTIVTTKDILNANEKNNYIWVILCSIFGVLFIVECLCIFIFCKKKNNKKENHNDDDNGSKSNSSMKMNSSVLPVLVLLAASVIMPVLGPIMFACIVAAIVVVPITIYLLSKKRKSKPIVTNVEELACSQVMSNDSDESSETTIVADIVNTENHHTEKQ